MSSSPPKRSRRPLAAAPATPGGSRLPEAFVLSAGTVGEPAISPICWYPNRIGLGSDGAGRTCARVDPAGSEAVEQQVRDLERAAAKQQSQMLELQAQIHEAEQHLASLRAQLVNLPGGLSTQRSDLLRVLQATRAAEGLVAA